MQSLVAADCMRELLHTLRCDFCTFKIHRASERGRGVSLCLFISSLTCFSRHNFRTQHSYRNRYFKNKASVALNPLVSRLVARSGRKRGNRRTDGRMTNQVLLVEMLGILWASGARTQKYVYTTIIITSYVPTGKMFQQVTEVIMVLSYQVE